MDKITTFKEAIKTALAFVTVFGIAMQLGWMNPYWAGWAVAVIALPTAGASIRKGTLRVAGTIPGCLAALAIHALAPQDRWIFLLLTCAWVFCTTYLMVSRKNDSYFWTMACYVCLIILLSDLDSSENMFASAVFRTVETVMGVVVYTLISVFLWPQTSRGAIRKSGSDLAASLNDICRSGRDRLLGRQSPESDFQGLQARVVQQLARFEQALQAEGSESYEVSEASPLWERFHMLSTALLETVGRWHSSFAELTQLDVQAVFHELPEFFSQLDANLAAVSQVLAGRSPDGPTRTVGLVIDPSALQHLSSFDRASVEVARKEMERLPSLSAALVECALELEGHAASARESKTPLIPGYRDRAHGFPVPDWDHLRSAAFVTATTAVGFLIWILFDPPGHTLWFQFSGTIALLVALVPQLRASTLIAPVAVTSAICLAIYVFVMPQLSTFLGLGSLLFITMFLVCYFLSGMARFFACMAILNILQIQNHQVYSFVAMANAYIFFVMSFAFLFVMSYLLSSPRPEKAVLHLLNRFFRSAEFLMSPKAAKPGHESAIDRWRRAFHERQLISLPAKLAAWGKSIDPKRFPDNTPEQIQALVASTQALVYRIEQFLEAGAFRQAEPLARELRDDILKWHAGIEATFGRWSRNPEAEPVAALRQRLETGLSRLEDRIKEVLNRAGGNVSREEGENFFRLLGGYRGVSEAALAYASAAGLIHWSHWREERFT
jgi:uncharacterized membrane protein YccC